MSFHIIELPFILIPALLITVFWFWMLIDCLSNRSLRGGQKVLWLLFILFTHILGAIVYFFFGRAKKLA